MYKIFLTFVALIFMAGCTKDDGGGIFGSMSATIDGESWTTSSRVTLLQDNKFIITGTSTSKESLVIDIFGTTENDYLLNLTTIQCAALYKKSAESTSEDAYTGYQGNVSLTDVDNTNKKISGTFSFTVFNQVFDTLSIIDGKFNNLKYQ